MIVIDASAAVDFILNIPPHGATIASRLTANNSGLAAPHLLDVEVSQVLRRFVRSGTITVARAEAGLVDLAALPIIRYPHGPLLSRAFDLRDNATMYDAVYLVLAEGLGATFITRDAALAKIPGHHARVDLVN